MKYRQICTIAVAAGSIALANIATASHHGNKQGLGGGCHGDDTCRAERQMQMRQQDSAMHKEPANSESHDAVHQRNNTWRGATEYQKIIDTLNATPKGELSDWERSYLAYRMEEEKTARDVYITLDKKWHMRPFTNIKQSEQWHMNVMEALREKYGFDNNYLTKNAVGTFENAKFQKLYNDLVTKGLRSKKDALEVGMKIEDMDLYDLDESLKKATNRDIRMVLEKFIEGSSHHMQAFEKNLKKIGGSYTPEHISKERMAIALSVPKHGRESAKASRGEQEAHAMEEDFTPLMQETPMRGSENAAAAAQKTVRDAQNWWHKLLDLLFFWRS